jgi:hypothetical protein
MVNTMVAAMVVMSAGIGVSVVLGGGEASAWAAAGVNVVVFLGLAARLLSGRER